MDPFLLAFAIWLSVAVGLGLWLAYDHGRRPWETLQPVPFLIAFWPIVIFAGLAMSPFMIAIWLGEQRRAPDPAPTEGVGETPHPEGGQT